MYLLFESEMIIYYLQDLNQLALSANLFVTTQIQVRTGS